MHPLPSLDNSIYHQRISERPAAQEESQVSNGREERQRRQAKFRQEEKEVADSR